jgi:hypothetical protein
MYSGRSPTSRERILGERDAHKLDRGIVRAATCTTLAKLLADE